MLTQFLAAISAGAVVSDVLPMGEPGGWLGLFVVVGPMALRIFSMADEGWLRWLHRLGAALQVMLALGVLGIVVVGYSDQWWVAIACVVVTVLSLSMTHRVLLPSEEVAERRLSEGMGRPLDLLVVVGAGPVMGWGLCGLGFAVAAFLLGTGRDPVTAVVVGLFSVAGWFMGAQAIAEPLTPYFDGLGRWIWRLQRAAFGVGGLALLGLPATDLDLPRLVMWGGVAGGLILVAGVILGDRPQPSHWVVAQEGLVRFSDGATDLFSWEIVTAARVEAGRIRLSVSGAPDRYVLGPGSRARRRIPEFLILEESLIGSTPEEFAVLVNQARESMAFRLTLPTFRFADGTDEEVLGDLQG